uniref:Uncharacterized protein n=1 Tax=Cacopsylla melanoneura TaxID=428564 RepID=A0A8D8TAS4_9HEMI
MEEANKPQDVKEETEKNCCSGFKRWKWMQSAFLAVFTVWLIFVVGRSLNSSESTVDEVRNTLMIQSVGCLVCLCGFLLRCFIIHVAKELKKLFFILLYLLFLIGTLFYASTPTPDTAILRRLVDFHLMFLIIFLIFSFCTFCSVCF